MKKMLLLCPWAIVLVFGAGSALAQPNYQFSEAGTKNFISETTIAPGDPISLDLWLTDIPDDLPAPGDGSPDPQYAGGAWIDFTGSTAEISYVSVGAGVLSMAVKAVPVPGHPVSVHWQMSL